MSQLEQEVDKLIGEFGEWFSGKGNDPLVRSEVAITKTFLWYLVNEKGVDPHHLGMAMRAVGALEPELKEKPNGA